MHELAHQHIKRRRQGLGLGLGLGNPVRFRVRLTLTLTVNLNSNPNPNPNPLTLTLTLTLTLNLRGKDGIRVAASRTAVLLEDELVDAALAAGTKDDDIGGHLLAGGHLEAIGGEAWRHATAASA